MGLINQKFHVEIRVEYMIRNWDKVHKEWEKIEALWWS